jgi:hypothetical protein
LPHEQNYESFWAGGLPLAILILQLSPQKQRKLITGKIKIES